MSLRCFASFVHPELVEFVLLFLRALAIIRMVYRRSAPDSPSSCEQKRDLWVLFLDAARVVLGAIMVRSFGAVLVAVREVLGAMVGSLGAVLGAAREVPAGRWCFVFCKGGVWC